MPSPTLSSYGGPTSPDALVLMLHGGRPHSQEPVGGRSASWLRSAWMARSIAGDLGRAGVGVSLLRYRQRGWNGGAGATADARWALDELRAAHGGVPVVVLGHSMGARVAVHVADDPSVVGVVGLAPWWSAQDPVRTLAGRSLVAAHGRADRITSFTETERYVRRARTVATSAELVDMGRLGHYLLGEAGRWNGVAVDSSLQALGISVG
ncbi:alpha/beta hydrolase [Nocardioides piscis]|uniref:alpha/beta hydrolase n=1 Tax=Nocardioides piscis TaxID=2714938 RepID=UPI001980DF42|nr:alpha/beta fold hydrolase [Nocardioides piscis]